MKIRDSRYLQTKTTTSEALVEISLDFVWKIINYRRALFRIAVEPTQHGWHETNVKTNTTYNGQIE